MQDSEWDKPFETRVFRMPVVSWPGSIEVCGYCTAAQMQPELVAALVVETEKAIRGRTGAPKSLTVLRRLMKYGQLSHAFFARSDSPEWWDSYRKIQDSDPGIVFPTLRLVAEPGWAIGERFGWINYFGPRAAAELGLDEAAGQAKLYKVEETPNGGRLVWLTKEPFNFCDAGHRRVFRELVASISGSGSSRSLC